MAGRDWQVNKSILECNKYMLENQLDCDVIFNFLSADGVTLTITAHKYMLISRSPVFYAMLAGPAREESGNILIPDIEKNIFEELLRYVHF